MESSVNHSTPSRRNPAGGPSATAAARPGTRHTRTDVVDAALALLDQYGLPDLTMRRLASDLGVQASALYWHFANKQLLLAAVAERIVAPGAPRDAADWAADLIAEAHATRDALLTYRDGAELVSSTLALGLGATGPTARLAAIIYRGGLDNGPSEAAAATVIHFILGYVWHEQQRMQADSLGVVDASAAANPASASVSDLSSPGDFDFGLSLLVGGIRLQAPTRA
ncbi:TetR/AcrR family transcriptional regulator C-terminal domain-containing protein [Glaciihabitans sp. dw_435]|uniref:TetR/AcrR family transcriptional regulator C-terminal domain-containing protein n=1 Tax=Glaciihabitans sp. dw_435 TaxID=2720081 RepID=UPI001BD668EB|nr:TetR/AcrR family transcriptional regulator C-terminal domain-containing protein [Glaciihabitans sp. dw_435]